MYTYRNLGHNGRLGNQMFQYATLLAQGLRRGVKITIPDSVTREAFPLNGEYELLTAFPNLSATKASQKDMAHITDQYQEKSFLYDRNITLIKDNVDLFGFFQSELYFADAQEVIRSEFAFSPDIVLSSRSKLDEIRRRNIAGTSATNVCALHVRRGDYKNSPEYHTNLGPEYYNPAITDILSSFENCQIVVFSDDIEWCKNNMPPETIFSTADNQFEDMCMMSMCDTHIIANSSFSWWAAWLSDSKRVIAPKRWFGTTGPADYNTIYCRNWFIA